MKKQFSCFLLLLNLEHDHIMSTSISVSKTLAISQRQFHCMTTYKPTAITTDRKDSDSSVQRELSYPSRHAVFRVTQSKLPRPIKYDRKCGRLTTGFQPCSIIYALSPWRDRNNKNINFVTGKILLTSQIYHNKYE